MKAEKGKRKYKGQVLSSILYPEDDGKNNFIKLIENGHILSINQEKRFYNPTRVDYYNHQDNDGYTALMYAIKNDRKNVIKDLINFFRVSVCPHNNDGKNALTLAEEKWGNSTVEIDVYNLELIEGRRNEELDNRMNTFNKTDFGKRISKIPGATDSIEKGLEDKC